MLGFVVARADSRHVRAVPALIGQCRTLQLADHLTAGPCVVWLYRTEGLNDYRVDFGQGRILVAAGTVMLGRLRGVHALQRIADRLLRGEQLADIFADLRGPFSLLSVDPGAGQVLHLSDRDGLMRCYQARSQGEILTSTSLLLLAALTDGAVDMLAVQEFVHGGGPVAGRTLFADIEIVPAATLSDLGDRQAGRRVLWRPTVQNPYAPESDAQIVDRMHAMFTAALDTERLSADKPFATDLTAGTDSRTVLSFLLKTGEPVVALTAGAAGSVDVERSQLLARKAGITHEWQQVQNSVDFDAQSLDDAVEYSDAAMSPFGLLKQVPYFKDKSRRFDIQFGGNGGPLFKDHYWLFEWNRIDRAEEPNWGRIARYSLTEGRVNDRLFERGVDYLQYMEALFRANVAGVRGTNNQKLDFMYFDFKCAAFAGPQYALFNRFMDIYHPMLDGHLVEYSMSIRPWIRQRARLQSELIYRNSPALAWVLTDNYVPCVPDTGIRAVLRLTRSLRYLRAARRKFDDFVLDRRNRTRDQRASTFVESLQRTRLADRFRQPEQLRLAPLLHLPEVSRLFNAVTEGTHSGYVQRIVALEAIFDRVEQLRGRRVEIGAA